MAVLSLLTAMQYRSKECVEAYLPCTSMETTKDTAIEHGKKVRLCLEDIGSDDSCEDGESEEESPEDGDEEDRLSWARPEVAAVVGRIESVGSGLSVFGVFDLAVVIGDGLEVIGIVRLVAEFLLCALDGVSVCDADLEDLNASDAGWLHFEADETLQEREEIEEEFHQVRHRQHELESHLHSRERRVDLQPRLSSL